MLVLFQKLLNLLLIFVTAGELARLCILRPSHVWEPAAADPPFSGWWGRCSICCHGPGLRHWPLQRGRGWTGKGLHCNYVTKCRLKHWMLTNSCLACVVQTKNRTALKKNTQGVLWPEHFARGTGENLGAITLKSRILNCGLAKGYMVHATWCKFVDGTMRLNF